MSELRLGDVIDDYCIKCRRLTNHSVVSLMNGEVAKVRCRSCYHDHDYLHEIAPPSKKDLKKAELLNAVLGEADPAAAAEGGGVAADLDVEDIDEKDVLDTEDEAEGDVEGEAAPDSTDEDEDQKPAAKKAAAKKAATKKKARVKKA